MYSFYGGRPGNSFVIITTYKSVDDMIQKFKMGPNYTAVHYDEYVMINTDNKNDPDNGKIYRRGYNFNDEETGGAEYIGCIAGPAGGAPHLHLTTIQDVQDKWQQAEQMYDTRYNQGSYSIGIDDDESLIPGKFYDDNLEETFNDKITWAYCSIKNQDDSETEAYIGFKIPYLVLDFQAQSIDPYSLNQELATRTDDGNHPFYEKWHFNIPKGIKGDSIKELRVEKDANGKEILVYDYYNYNNQEQGNSTKITLGNYNMIKDINISDDGTITIKYTHDEDKEFPNKLRWIKSLRVDKETGKFLATYNYPQNEEEEITKLELVKDISINDDGTIILHYTDHELDKVLESPQLQWISGVKLSKDGQLIICYNTGDEKPVESETEGEDNSIKWIESASLENDGTLKFQLNTKNENEQNEEIQVSNKIKWIDSVNLNEDGSFNFKYNTGDEKSIAGNVKWVTKAEIVNNETNSINNGKLKIFYSDGTSTIQDDVKIKWPINVRNQSNGIISIGWNDGTRTSLAQPIKMINTIELSNDGQITANYTSGDSQIFNSTNPIRWIQDISINTGSVEGQSNNDQKFYIKYNTSDTPVSIGNPINYIVQMKVNKNTGHLLVLYSDPQKRGNITYDGKSGWQDLGSVQIYDYNPGDIISNLQVTRIIGICFRNSSNEQVRNLKFTVPFTGSFDPIINTILLNRGYLIGRYKNTNSQTYTNFTTTMTSNNTSITKTATGLQFLVGITNIPIDAEIENQQIIFSIQNMELQFTFYSQQGG